MRSRKVHTPLTDVQLATVAWADEEETTAALARRIDDAYFTVYQARQRVRRAGGWWCPLLLDSCAVCHQPLLTASENPRQVHVACHAAREARRARQYRSEQRPYALSTKYVRAWSERHPDQEVARREREKASRRARWPSLPDDVRSEHLARAHEADARDYPVTRARATRSGATWTAEEDDSILARLDEPAREVALDLGRTLWAVRGRRVLLRRRVDTS